MPVLQEMGKQKWDAPSPTQPDTLPIYPYIAVLSLMYYGL
jgi:hypothetical protein